MRKRKVLSGSQSALGQPPESLFMPSPSTQQSQTQQSSQNDDEDTEEEDSNQSLQSEAALAAENLLSFSAIDKRKEDGKVSALPKVMKSYMQLQQQKSLGVVSSSQESTSPTKVRVALQPPVQPPPPVSTVEIIEPIKATKSKKAKQSESTPKKKRSSKEPSTGTDFNPMFSQSNGSDSPGTMDSSLIDSTIPFSPFDDILTSVDPNHFTLYASGMNGQEEEFKEFSIGNDSVPVITYSFTEDPSTRSWTVELFWPTERKALSWRGKFCFYVSIFRKDMMNNSYKLIMSKISSQFAVFSKPDVYLKKIKSSTTKKPESKKKEKNNTMTTVPPPEVPPNQPEERAAMSRLENMIAQIPHPSPYQSLQPIPIKTEQMNTLPPINQNQSLPSNQPLPNPSQILGNPPFVLKYPPPPLYMSPISPMNSLNPIGNSLLPPPPMSLQPKGEQKRTTIETHEAEGPVKKQKV